MIWQEILLFVFVMILAVKNILFKKYFSKILSIVELILIFIILLLNISNGIKLTMLFIWLSALLISIYELIHLFHPNHTYFIYKKIPSLSVMFLCSISLVLTIWLMPTFKVSLPNGQYKVGQVSEQIIDTSRKDPYNKSDVRKMMVSIYYPADTVDGCKQSTYLDGEAMAKSLNIPSFLGKYLNNVKSNSYINTKIINTDKKLPFVVFAHGMGSIPQAYLSIIEELASNGYIVACINYTDYSMFSVINDVNIPFKANDVDKAMGTVNKGSSKEIKAALDVWCTDTLFVINEFKKKNIAPMIADKVDFNNIAVMGHSFGGSTAAEVLFQDTNMKAGIDLDGAIYGDALNGVTQPFMFIISDREGIDYDKIKQSGGDAQRIKGIIKHFYSSITSLCNHSENTIYRVTIKGSSHSSFTDMLLYAPFKYLDAYPARIEPDKALAITKEYVIAFLNEKLKQSNNQVNAIKQDTIVHVECQN